MATPDTSEDTAPQHRAELRALAQNMSAGTGLEFGAALALLIVLEQAGVKLDADARGRVIAELKQHRGDIRAARLARIYDVNHPGQKVAG